jgi:hypothetical protein
VKYRTDQDGKSKTASGVDARHYPEKNEALFEPTDPKVRPTRAQIAARAHELWTARGCPQGSSEQDWLQAEADLKRELQEHAPLKGVRKKTGSVQP